jgi:signal transduction histidine kinase
MSAAIDEIRMQVVIMVKEQNETLATRSAQFYDEYQKALILGLGINAIAICVLIMCYRLVRSSLRKREEIEHMLKLSNENLESTVEKRTEQLSVLSRHLISISEEEKIRLSRELHDEMGANLTAISMDLSAVTLRLLRSEPTLAAQLQRAKITLVDAINLKRRIIENLRPSLLDNLGLNAAIESYCEDFSRMCNVKCTVDVDPDIDQGIDDREPTLAIALFRIV